MEIKKLFDRDVQRSYGPGRQDRVDANKQEQANPAPAQAGEDVVSLSSRSRELSRVTDSAAGVLASDELRTRDRVEQLKQAVANGTYNVSSEDVAKSIFAFVADGTVTER